MAQPLVAQYRAQILYDVSIGGQVVTHKYQPYAQVLDAGVGITPRYRFITRGGDSTTNWADYIAAWALLAGNLWATGTTIPYNAELQIFISNQWLPLDSANGNIVGSESAGTPQKAYQNTATFKDSQFHILRVEQFETIANPIAKYKTIADLSAGFANYYGSYTSTSSTITDPWHWVVSRSNLYLADNGFRGLSVFTNKKLARRRGV